MNPDLGQVGRWHTTSSSMLCVWKGQWQLLWPCSSSIVFRLSRFFDALVLNGSRLEYTCSCHGWVRGIGKDGVSVQIQAVFDVEQRRVQHSVDGGCIYLELRRPLGRNYLFKIRSCVLVGMQAAHCDVLYSKRAGLVIIKNVQSSDVVRWEDRAELASKIGGSATMLLSS